MKIFTFFIVMLISGIDTAQAKNKAGEFSEFYCLSETIYHESRGEPIPGQFAVGSVVMNRVRSKHYPSTVCEVVHQPYQFSWTLIKTELGITDKKSWRNAQQIAWILLHGGMRSNIGTALDYHSVDVNPKWAKSNVKTLTLGRHIFYTRDKS